MRRLKRALLIAAVVITTTILGLYIAGYRLYIRTTISDMHDVIVLTEDLVRCNDYLLSSHFSPECMSEVWRINGPCFEGVDQSNPRTGSWGIWENGVLLQTLALKEAEKGNLEAAKLDVIDSSYYLEKVLEMAMNPGERVYIGPPPSGRKSFHSEPEPPPPSEKDPAPGYQA